MAVPQGILEKVRAVARMGRLELVSEWQVQFGAPPPPKLRVELMRPVLVYRIQEKVFARSAPRRNSRIEDLASDANRRSFKTGTKIVREWKGQLHEVGASQRRAIYIRATCTKSNHLIQVHVRPLY